MGMAARLSDGVNVGFFMFISLWERQSYLVKIDKTDLKMESRFP